MDREKNGPRDEHLVEFGFFKMWCVILKIISMMKKKI